MWERGVPIIFLELIFYFIFLFPTRVNIGAPCDVKTDCATRFGRALWATFRLSHTCRSKLARAFFIQKGRFTPLPMAFLAAINWIDHEGTARFFWPQHYRAILFQIDYFFGILFLFYLATKALLAKVSIANFDLFRFQLALIGHNLLVAPLTVWWVDP